VGLVSWLGLDWLGCLAGWMLPRFWAIDELVLTKCVSSQQPSQWQSAERVSQIGQK